MTTTADSAALPAAVLPAEGWADRLWTGAAWALDSAVTEATRRVIDAAVAPRAAELPALRAAAAPYMAPPLRDEPQRFFAFLAAPAEAVEPRTVSHRARAGGAIVGRRFATAYTPWAEEATPAGDVHVEHWTHERRTPRATVLAVHGFAMGTPRLDAWALCAADWFARGLDVALLTLPYHGARTPAGARFSGQRFADPNPARLHEAVRRAVYEMHVVRAWLAATSGAPVGLLGLSLGGYLAALTAGLVDDLAFVVPMVPPACFGDLAWHFLGAGRARRAAGYGHAELRAMFRLHSPLTHPLRSERRRALIVAGRGDRIVPPEHPHALWEHWGRPAIHWFSGSHLAPFGRAGIVAAVTEHLRRLGIL